MMRIAITCMFIIGLLICPLRCGKSCSANSGDGSQVLSDCCSDCNHSPRDNNSSDEQTPPQRDCDCVSCYCKGAIVSSGFEWIDGCVLAVTWNEVSCKSLCDFDQVSSFSNIGEPLRKHGRSMRIALQSWLI